MVWTRGRWAPDLLPQICDWFADRGFDELWVSDPAEGWGAAAHRFTGTPDPLEEGPACSPSAAITPVPALPGIIFLYLPNEPWYLPPDYGPKSP